VQTDLAPLLADDKQGRPFLHEVVVTPLCGADGSVELIRATSRSVRRLQSSCGNGDVSIDVQGGEGLDERDGRGSVDTTVAALAAVICQKRARDQSPAFQRAITTSVPPSLSMPCPVVSMVVLTAPKPPCAHMGHHICHHTCHQTCAMHAPRR
jgi:hypothetical protein